MEDHDAKRHPGPWRVMRVDSEFAGILLAVGFLVMGLVSMPVGTGFVLGSITLGVVVALLLRFTPKKFSRVVLGIVIILAAGVLWWLGHKPRRPRTVSSNALYVLPNNVPWLHQTGYWLECWFASMTMLIDANLRMNTEPCRLRTCSSDAKAAPHSPRANWSLNGRPDAHGSNRVTRGSMPRSFTSHSAKSYFREASTQKPSKKSIVIEEHLT